MKEQLEIEMKFPMPDIDKNDFIKKLIDMGAVKGERVFENNMILDNFDSQLQGVGHLLRLRKVDDRTVLTYKGDVKKDKEMKIREEIETEVENYDTMLEILRRLGYNVIKIYQKYRQAFEFNSVVLTIDELPFGKYIEIEGDKEKILELAEELELEKTDICNMNYIGIYYKVCSQKGIEASNHITFDS